MSKYYDLKEEVDKLSKAGRYMDAIKAMNKYIEEVKLRDGEESSRIITLLNDLGGMYRNVGYFDEAESTFNQVLIKIDKLNGAESEQYATATVNLACMYRFINKYEKAERLFLEAIKKYDNIKMDDKDEYNKLYANACNNLGVLYQDMNNHEVAEIYHTKALNLLKEINHHEYIAITLNNLANPLVELKQFSEAINLLNESLTIFEEELSTKHPLYLTAISNLGAIYFQQGDVDLAIRNFENALVIMKESYGEYSPQYRDVYENLMIAKNTRNKIAAKQ